MVTIKTIERVYELLKELPPFNKWSLPPKSKIAFGFAKERNVYGIYFPKEGLKKHIINVCRDITITKLPEVMAHEMVHLKQCIAGKRIRSLVSEKDWHDREFQKLAKDVCKSLRFNYKEF